MNAIALLAGLVFIVAGALVSLRYTETHRIQAGARTLRLIFPIELETEAVERLLASLTGLLPPWWRRLLAQPAVIFETRATAEGIQHFLTVPPSVWTSQ